MEVVSLMKNIKYNEVNRSIANDKIKEFMKKLEDNVELEHKEKLYRFEFEPNQDGTYNLVASKINYN